MFGVFVDLDTVNHSILCEKREYYGLHGNVNNLIRSYLANRKHFISIYGFDSQLRDLLCGVPQGSSLGPLLFLIYIKLVSKWLRLNKLALNAVKTEHIFFRSKEHFLDYDKISIYYNGLKLILVDHVKYFGMYFDKYLSCVKIKQEVK